MDIFEILAKTFAVSILAAFAVGIWAAIIWFAKEVWSEIFPRKDNP